MDDAGKPVPEAYVGVAEWQGKNALHNKKHPSVHDTRVPNRADDNGVYEWGWAPQSPVKFSVQSGGSSVAVVAAGGELEQTVVLKGPHVVIGRVTDARTGQPIPAFTVVPVNVFRRDFFRGERANAETGRDGALKFLVRRDDSPQRLRVEAMGYRTVIGREFKRDVDARVQDFVLEPAGEYDLAVSVYAQPTGCLTDPLAQAVVRVSVSEADVERGEVSLPDVTADVRPVPEVGTTPTLAFRKADGSAATLADIRGKPTLVHFWASWCAPCKRQLPAVAQLQETAAGMDVVGLSLDEDAVAWQEALGTLALPWPQGRVANPADAGIWSVPAYWLLDASGKIVAKVYDADELPSLIEKHFE